MTKLKRLMCLFLVVAMSASVFTACTKKGGGSSSGANGGELAELTDEDITLSYTFWEDHIIVNALIEKWKELHPNITIEPQEFATGEYNDQLLALGAAGDLPDVFWILGECDYSITNGYLKDMTGMWEADDDTKNVLASINEYKIGYFGTDYKWTTPVKYFPTAAWANKALFEKLEVAMPETTWTWEDMEKSVEDMTQGEGADSTFGMTEAYTVITWYPVASDPKCIGEFGWDGKEFDLTNWAYGLNLEAKWTNEGYKAPVDEETLTSLYGDTTFAQDRGMAAYHIAAWWVWERFWIKDEVGVGRGNIWVPYVMPHTADNQDSVTNIAIMDFGGISASTEWPREAYEVLKFFTWGAEGWKYKLELYPTLYTDDGTNIKIEKNNMPICTDDDIWEGFRAWHPDDSDEYGRGPWFDYFIDYSKTCKPVPLAGQQIPGFSTWLETYYNGDVMVEDQVINQNKNANDFVDDLTKTANEENKQRLKDIEELLVTE